MYKVILIDDDTFIRKGLLQLIPWESYNLEVAAEAANGTEALALLASMQADILVTDICMPEMDGIELLREVNRLYPAIKSIILSSYNEFDYVKQAAMLGIENYILKPVDDTELVNTLIATIKKIEIETTKKQMEAEGIQVLRNHVLSRWVSSSIDEYELRSKASFIGLNLDANEYMVAIVSDFGLMRLNHDVYRSVTSVWSGSASERIAPTFFTDDYDGSLILIYAASSISSSLQQIAEQLQHIADVSSQLPDASAFITVSKPAAGYKSVAACYTEAKRLQNYALVQGKNRIIYQGEMDNSAKLAQTSNIDYTRLIAAVKTKNRQAILQFITDTLAPHSDLTGLKKTEFIHNTAIEILFHILTTVKSINMGAYAVFENYRDFFIGVYSFTDVRALQDWLISRVEKMISILADEDDKSNTIVKRTKKYIEQHYQDFNINLKTIAGHFRMNAYYLGQLFKEGTGESFTHFLNNYRVEQAKQLLSSGAAKVNEVAEQVGYTNTKYFYTIFKSIVGVSPATYRDGLES